MIWINLACCYFCQKALVWKWHPSNVTCLAASTSHCSSKTNLINTSAELHLWYLLRPHATVTGVASTALKGILSRHTLLNSSKTHQYPSSMDEPMYTIIPSVHYSYLKTSPFHSEVRLEFQIFLNSHRLLFLVLLSLWNSYFQESASEPSEVK